MTKLISGLMQCNSGIKRGLAQTIHSQNLKWNVKKNQIVNLQVQTKQGSYYCLNQTITIDRS